MTAQRTSRRSGGRKARWAAAQREAASAFDARGVPSGAVRTLTDAEKSGIHAAALDVLETVGFGEAPDFTRERLTAAGCRLDDAGRVRFPRSLVEDTIARANRALVLHGQRPEHDIDASGSKTWFSTGCGSVRVVDPESRTTRPTTAADVYDFARLVDALDHIHMFHRLGIPTDIEDTDDVDINLCYACVRGTSKPVSTSWFNGENVRRSIEMLGIVAGGEAEWRRRPFVLNTCCFVVPPLKFAPESCLGLEHSVRGGMPVQLTSAGQMGATAPVSVAGTLVQTIAEVLGGLVYAYQIRPDAKVMLGTWPMVSDLRTGAATTGSAEQALVSSASCQMARFYGIPNGSISGISDSKLPDAQSGFEKGVQHALVGNSGGNVLFCAAGALAAGLGCSHAGVVIDNEIIGTALRTVAGFEVNEETMGVDMIREVCLSGPGHYLGHEATLRQMKDGFHYPSLSDRSGMNDWLESGSRSILDHAAARARRILDSHFPAHVCAAADAEVRARFDILLPPERCRGAVEEERANGFAGARGPGCVGTT